MLRSCLPLAAFFLASTASAATLSWEQAEVAEACLSPASVERQVEARLGRRLTELDATRALRVRVEPRGKSWVARIEMRDREGSVLGRRVLTLSDDPCQQLEGFVALALALMIDPESALLPEPTPPEASAPPPSLESETPARAEEPAPEPAAVPPPDFATVSGSGKTTVYLYPAVLPLDLSRNWPRGVAAQATARLAERLFAHRLLQREVYTIVEAPTHFDTMRDAESWVRDARERSPKPLMTANGPAKPPDFALIWHVQELTLQDGYDYSLGTRARVTAVGLRLRVVGVDFQRKRELESIEVKTGFSIEGSRRDEALRKFALQLALEKAADQLLDALRPEPAFRIRPRVVEDRDPHVELPSLRGVGAGDRFEFEDENGKRSGYASVYDVEAGRARLSVLDRGRGERVVLLAKARRTVHSVAVQGNYRFAYAEPSASDVARAADTMRSTRFFGAGTELGLDWKIWREPASGSRFRTLLELGWTFIASRNLALSWEAKGGIGYEVPLIPAIGLGATPFAALGGMWIRGTLGPDDSSERYAKLDGLLGATGNVGVQLEFYRLFGDFSPLALAQFQYVLPLLSGSSRSEFVDDRYPDLHALGVHLGCVWRPADYPN
ncbi:MAG: hypothetical protein ACOY0T_18555 [Myxococcota bacterium]